MQYFDTVQRAQPDSALLTCWVLVVRKLCSRVARSPRPHARLSVDSNAAPRTCRDTDFASIR